MSEHRPGDPATVVVARFNYRHEAEYARGFLDDAALESALYFDDAGGIEMGLSFSNPARLIVRQQDAARARELLTAAGLQDALATS
ncbi:MAG TPA: hypothetical protein VK912_20060 [Longimicrobiales bacterium]|nr:hypothetical protein [Longimicrobiales bacterium]